LLDFKRRLAPSALLVVIGLALVPLTLSAAWPARALHLGGIKHAINGAEAAHPNALWHIVHDLCARDVRISGDPAPCAKVDLRAGYALIKDVERPTQYLLLPTARITGIESPSLLAADAPNYWRSAWANRGYVEKQIGRPVGRDGIGLAVNSYGGRTQNQLHIHIDCVSPETRQAVDAAAGRLGSHWSELTLGPRGVRYRARWIAGQDPPADPFKLVARTDGLARADMGRMSLALIPADKPHGVPGFVLLSDRSGDDHDAAAEELLDHHCRGLTTAG
jgi:CDP-diacylglycerol pyrophosphatase